MKKSSIIALMAALASASCAGNNSSLIPAAGTNGMPGSTTARAIPVNAGAKYSPETAPSGWAATATHGIVPREGSDIGRLATPQLAARALNGQPMTVRVGLTLRNVEALKSAIANRQIVSRDEFLARYAPTSADVAAFTQYLRGQGFHDMTVSPDNLLVSGRGTPQQMESAFHTRLEAFSTKHGVEYSNVTAAFVPARFSKIVTGVLGLTTVTRMMMTPHPSPCFPTDPAPSPVPCVRSYGPQEVQTYYDAGNTPTGSLTTVAVMAEGDVSDTTPSLRLAERTYGLPQVPVTVVHVGLPSPDTAGADEWDLDTQASTGIAGNVKALYIYDTTSLTDSDIANEYSHWVNDDLAQLGNSSFGECEYSAYLDGSMAVDDNTLMEGAAHGQTMFASTGDTGSQCPVGVGANGAPAGAPMVNYPASSPWVVGAGGTTVLSNNDDTYLGEAAWYSGGGGLSQFENSPRYMQKVQVVGGTVAEANLRGLPDVAMAGDPNAGGYNVWANIPIQTSTGPCTNPCGVGGTSESAPLSMGTYARLQSAHNNALGFGGVALYAEYAANSTSSATLTGPPPTQVVGGFHDILTGSNGAYTALPGYDYTTGMGSFDISLMNQLIGH